ncbi:hypothetical protein BDN70DRAFT_778187, partial [Pholiota conissans]
MAIFEARPFRQHQSNMNRLIRKHPSVFGVPFVLIIVAASFGLTTFTQTRYDVHDQKVKHVTKEQELKLDKNRKKFDIREEYFRLSAAANEDWEPKRISRPAGVPEWGVPPTEPPS